MPRLRSSGGGAEKEGRAGEIAGDVGFDGSEWLSSANARRVAVPLDLGTEGLEREFSVIAGTNGLFDNSIAAGEESGKEDAGFHLGTGDFRLVMNRVKRASVDLERRPAAIRRSNLRAHFRERLDDPGHGTAGKGFVAE